VNINTAGNYTVTAVSGTLFGIIDGPSDSGNFTINPVLTVNPEDGAVGTEVEIEGSYFGAYKEVTLTFDDEVIETLTTDESGGFSTTYTIDTSIGEYFVDVSYNGLSFESYNYKMFFVLPAIILSPDTGFPTTVMGISFAAAKYVAIECNGAAIPTVPMNPKTENDGNFTCLITMTDGTAGNYNIMAIDEDGNNATAMFTVPDMTGPKGDKGDQGDTGPKGPAGEAAAEILGGPLMPIIALLIAIIAVIVALSHNGRTQKITNKTNFSPSFF
jgi:hypothetical protein